MTISYRPLLSQDDIHDVLEADAFVDGFSLGMMIAIEVMEKKF